MGETRWVCLHATGGLIGRLGSVGEVGGDDLDRWDDVKPRTSSLIHKDERFLTSLCCLFSQRS